MLDAANSSGSTYATWPVRSSTVRAQPLQSFDAHSLFELRLV